MPAERWGPSWELRVLAGVQGIVDIGLLGVFMWFFFPHALLVPVMAVAAAGFAAVFILPSRVVLLDAGRGEVAITVALWTRHVPLTQVTRVEQVGLGAEISTGDGWSYGFTPFAKRRRLVTRLRPRLRTGFEGMETAITRAAAVARGDDPGTPLPGKTGSARGALAACLVTGFGVLRRAARSCTTPRTCSRPCPGSSGR
jgi:hypothetical protein